MEVSKSWVEIDLGAVVHNFLALRRRVGAGVRVMAVVKSDAYGHGAPQVSRALAEAGAEVFGVATVEEGVALREVGIDLPILVLGCIFKEEIGDIIRYSLIPNLCSEPLALELSRRAGDMVVKVHVKVDTGMGGLGVRPEEAIRFVEGVVRFKNLFLEGIFTHFSSSCQEDKGCTYEQIRVFKDILARLGALGIEIPLRHMANSGAILDVPMSYFNMVRPGLLLYGLYPSDKVRRSVEVRPVMTLKSRLAFFKNLCVGDTVSYERTFRASRPTRVGILPIGYDNGYSLSLSNKGEVVIRGRRLPVIGRVRMNHIQVDTTDLPEAEVGDEAILYGGQFPSAVSVEDVARLTETIPYQVVCATGRTNPRVYLNGTN